MYRTVVALTPRPHRARHGDSQITLFGDLLATGESPSRLWIGVLPDLLRVLATYRTEVSCRLTRAGLAVAGLAPIGVGLAVGATWLDEYGDVPPMFPAAAAALILQGTFGSLWLTRRVDGWRPMADRVFLSGEIAALALGAIVVALALTTRSPANPEALRLLVGGVAAAHSLLGLTAFRLTRRRVAASQ